MRGEVNCAREGIGIQLNENRKDLLRKRKKFSNLKAKGERIEGEEGQA